MIPQVTIISIYNIQISHKVTLIVLSLSFKSNKVKSSVVYRFYLPETETFKIQENTLKLGWYTSITLSLSYSSILPLHSMCHYDALQFPP